jgi:glycosyltransferase involved in cell wall biosynthesis
LIQNLPGQVTILAPSIQEKVEEGEQVIRCWNIGEEDTLAKLKEKINSENIDTLVIQFNYGFFNLDLFSDFLIEQTNKGLIIIVMMHSTVDPIHAPHKKLSILIPALSCCHRILVHSPNDMNRLKSYGLINNVALFPHGILDFEDSEFSVKAKEKEFLITSYGFFLPHKGLLELIEAISILRNQNVSVKLNMLNAEYPAPESRLMIDKAKKLISDLKLNDAITLCADFLDDYESLNKLSQSDLILFPYQNTGESASGAVRYGLSAGIPVAVTPLSIFEDVDSVVFKLPGQSSQHIAEGIVEIREKLLLQDSLAVEIMETAKNWRAQHRYSIIGKMLFNLIRSIQINGKY